MVALCGTLHANVQIQTYRYSCQRLVFYDGTGKAPTSKFARCKPKTYKELDGEKCLPCPPGSFCPDGIKAILCPIGKYSPGGDDTCISCRDDGGYADTPGSRACKGDSLRSTHVPTQMLTFPPSFTTFETSRNSHTDAIYLSRTRLGFAFCID